MHRFVITVFAKISGNVSKVLDCHLCVAVKMVGPEDIAKKMSMNACFCLVRTEASVLMFQALIHAHVYLVRLININGESLFENCTICNYNSCNYTCITIIFILMEYFYIHTIQYSYYIIVLINPTLYNMYIYIYIYINLNSILHSSIRDNIFSHSI
jgi:hypothetical protein